MESGHVMRYAKASQRNRLVRQGAGPDSASASYGIGCFFLNPLPGTLHVTRGRIRLSHAETQREAIVQPRVGEIKVATAIQTIHQRLIDFVSTLVTETDQV